MTLAAYVAPLPVGLDGWSSAQGDTWTYASATTFTIAGVDRTALFTKGTRLKLTNSTLKYFVVVASAFSTDTTVTVTGGTDYTLANAAITSPFYSYQANPQGYPSQFNVTLGFTGFSANPSTTARFTVIGNVCTLFYYYGTTGTSSTTAFTITGLPVSSLVSPSLYGPYNGADNGTNVQTVTASLAGTTLTLSKTVGGGGTDWTGSSVKAIYSFVLSWLI